MCGGPEFLMMGSAALNAVGQINTANVNATNRVRQSIEETQVAEAHARQIQVATRRRAGAARAATAASGVALDEFAQMIPEEIEREGAMDAAMTILTGQRRSRAAMRAADEEEDAGLFDAVGGLVGSGASIYGGWKGQQGAPSVGGTSYTGVQRGGDRGTRGGY